MMKKEARLILDDGTEFCGWSFGYEANAVGEVVFSTAMTGYPESLTDPSYAGQILVTTYPSWRIIAKSTAIGMPRSRSQNG